MKVESLERESTLDYQDHYLAARLAAERARSSLCKAHGGILGTCKKCKTAWAQLVKEAVASVFAARRDRKVHPEGKFDRAKRFYPSDREDAEGSGSRVRAPTRGYPFSYMTRCRTRQHCKTLVERALRDIDVPNDVLVEVRAMREQATLAGINPA